MFVLLSEQNTKSKAVVFGGHQDYLNNEKRVFVGEARKKTSHLKDVITSQPLVCQLFLKCTDYSKAIHNYSCTCHTVEKTCYVYYSII